MAMSRAVKGLLIDLSGTVHIEDRPTESAVEALVRLHRSKLPYLFVSNTSKESRKHILERLLRAGFDDSTVDVEKILTSLSAADLKLRTVNQPTFPLISPHSMVELPTQLMHEAKDFSQKCVLVGLAPDKFTYANMNYAFQLLSSPNSTLMALNKGRFHATSSGLSLGPGPFVEALEFATGHKAVVIGKPSPDFFQRGAQYLSLDLSECAMIGDDVIDDVVGALDSGVGFGVLVKTGKYRTGDEQRLNKDRFGPNRVRVADSFASFVDELIDT